MIGESHTPDFTHTINALHDTEIMTGGHYIITPINTLGTDGTPGEIAIVPKADTVAPEQPTGFAINVQGETTEIFWHLSNSPDVDFYEIRYSPLLVGASYGSAQHLTRVSICH